MKKKPKTRPASYFQVGDAYLIRTVTHYWTGKVVQVLDNGLVLSCAAWVADTGRWHNAIAEGKLNEVEPVPGEVFVALGAIVDACQWNHPLPDKQK